MAPRSRRAILCPSCGALTRVDVTRCDACGRWNPGLWGLRPTLTRLLAHGFTAPIVVACVALYAVAIVLDPLGALRPRGMFDLLSPSHHVLDALGMTGALAWARGRWWTLLTAIYLHGSVLHILFNVLWIRQLGPSIEELFGPARFFVIFTASGVAGFALSNVAGIPFTIGASGAIFGLLGALVAFGRSRGGVFGRMLFRQYGQWALLLFVLGFFMAGVNNLAHGGGFAGGYVAALGLSSLERRAEAGLDHALAWGLAALTLVGFALSIWAALAG